MNTIAMPEHLVCHDELNVLVLAGRQVAEVHSYSPAGSLLSEGKIPGFLAMQIIERGGRVTGYRPSPEGFHYGIEAHALTGSRVLLQIGVPINDPGMFFRIRSYVLDTSSGEIDELDTELPHILAFRGDQIAVAPATDYHLAYPRLAVYRRADEAAGARH